MENYTIYIYKNPLKHRFNSDKSMILIDKQKFTFVGIVQNNQDLNIRKRKIDEYRLKTYDIHQDNFWVLLNKDINIISINFSQIIDRDIYTELLEKIKCKEKFDELREEIELESEVQSITFRYKGHTYEINKRAVLNVAAENLNSLENLLTSSPILSLLGMRQKEGEEK